jgi:hypothetical protein
MSVSRFKYYIKIHNLKRLVIGHEDPLMHDYFICCSKRFRLHHHFDVGYKVKILIVRRATRKREQLVGLTFC